MWTTYLRNSDVNCPKVASILPVSGTTVVVGVVAIGPGPLGEGGAAGATADASAWAALVVALAPAAGCCFEHPTASAAASGNAHNTERLISLNTIMRIRELVPES